jgi:glycosyltransferase involved in cell wall biosynthesis
VNPYPGHYAVVRSVVEGLREIGADFTHDPRSFAALARVVYAPANEALRQAARLKRDGRIDFLVAGPSNAFFPEEADNILWLPEIDIIIEPSEWMREFFSEIAPPLVPKIRICTAGVDPRYWKPSGDAKPNRALIYWKSGDESFCEAVEKIVSNAGLDIVRLRYDHYRRDDYRDELDRSAIAIFLSSFETQGIALAEAWAMDVPTLIWNPRSDASWRGRSFIAKSSGPYLSAATGMDWVTLDDLDRVLRQALSNRAAFCPRKWVLANMTDATCSARLFEIIGNESRTRLQIRPR